MIGKVLGNRYELVEEIGGGGMAVVYKAKCKLLNRYVAVKILRPEFINDDEFVKRFRIEAQAAASLSHPNIVSIYDVGQEDDIYYIVMEYVDGITLKEYIKQKKVLSWRESVDIAIQVCSAIKHAHRNKIIHRDIKPLNILITKDNIAKVTDFGIARATSASTITMSGNTMGSVHYFSPEQARGGYIDEKSDLYSLGIVIYEMVTGKLPFEGDSPVAVALKHIQVPPEPPKSLNSEIPSGLNDIIMKAIEKDVGKRYQSAKDMLEDLNTVLKNPDASFITEKKDIDADTSPTKRMQVVNPETVKQEEEIVMKRKANAKKQKNDRLTVVLATIVSILIIAVFSCIAYIVMSPSSSKGSSDFVVQNYVGLEFDQVKDELAQYGIEAIKNEVYSDEYDAGYIVSQDPTEGKTLKKGGYSSIVFEVSKGEYTISLKDYSGQDYRVVEMALRELGLIPVIQEEYSDDYEIGKVTRTEPYAYSGVKEGDQVIIFRSKGPEFEKTVVPNLEGMTLNEAKKALEDASLTLGTIDPEGNTKGKIIKQEPLADEKVKVGSAVNIWFESKSNSNNNDKNDNKKDDDNDVKTITVPIKLTNPNMYGDKINVLIKITTYDGKETIQYEDKNKSEFPLYVTVPISDKGKTRLYVELDRKQVINQLY